MADMRGAPTSAMAPLSLPAQRYGIFLVNLACALTVKQSNNHLLWWLRLKFAAAVTSGVTSFLCANLGVKESASPK